MAVFNFSVANVSLDDSSTLEKIDSSNCLSSADPLEVPVEKFHHEAILRPGESLELPLVIQGHAPGTLNVASMFVFREVRIPRIRNERDS